MEDVFDHLGRARGVEHHARLLAKTADLREDPVEMDRRRRLGLDQEMIGADVREVGEIALRLDDHQVHIERLLRRAPHRCDDHRPDRDIRHEAAVHDVDMDPIRSRRIDGANRRCNDDRPLQRGVDHGYPGAQCVRARSGAAA